MTGSKEARLIVRNRYYLRQHVETGPYETFAIALAPNFMAYTVPRHSRMYRTIFLSSGGTSPSQQLALTTADYIIGHNSYVHYHALLTFINLLSSASVKISTVLR